MSKTAVSVTTFAAIDKSSGTLQLDGIVLGRISRSEAGAFFAVPAKGSKPLGPFGTATAAAERLIAEAGIDQQRPRLDALGFSDLMQHFRNEE